MEQEIDGVCLKMHFTSQINMETLFNSTHFLCRQTQKVIFCFSEGKCLKYISQNFIINKIILWFLDKFNIMKESPFTWVELDIQSLADAGSFKFRGETVWCINSEVERQYIYFEVKATTISRVFQSISSAALNRLDIRLGKTKYNALIIDATMRENGTSSTSHFEVPIYFVEKDHWSLIDGKERFEENFDFRFDMPNFGEFKKYAYNYKNYTNLWLTVCDSMLTIQGNEVDNTMRSSFINHTFNLTKKNANMSECSVLMVTKSFLGFLHAMNAMKFGYVQLKCSITHRKLIHFNFVIPNKNTKFNFIVHHVNEGIDLEIKQEEREHVDLLEDSLL